LDAIITMPFYAHHKPAAQVAVVVQKGVATQDESTIGFPASHETVFHAHTHEHHRRAQ
jgi:hypothetical protein